MFFTYVSWRLNQSRSISLARVATMVPSLTMGELYTFTSTLRNVHALRGTLAGAWQKGTFNVDAVGLLPRRRVRTRATAFLSLPSTLARRLGMAASLAARMAFRRTRIAASRALRSAVVRRAGDAVVRLALAAGAGTPPRVAACLSSATTFRPDKAGIILST